MAMNHDHEHGPRERDGGPEGGQGGCAQPDRIGHSAAQWKRAFDEALHEIRVELIKKEIAARWGAQLEATAKGAADAMHADWKKHWTENPDELKAELDDPDRKVRDIIRAEIKKALG